MSALSCVLLLASVVCILLALWAMPFQCDFVPRPVRWFSVLAHNTLAWAMFLAGAAALVVITALFTVLVLLCGALGWAAKTLYEAVRDLPLHKYPEK